MYPYLKVIGRCTWSFSFAWTLLTLARIWVITPIIQPRCLGKKRKRSQENTICWDCFQREAMKQKMTTLNRKPRPIGIYLIHSTLNYFRLSSTAICSAFFVKCSIYIWSRNGIRTRLRSLRFWLLVATIWHRLWWYIQ